MVLTMALGSLLGVSVMIVIFGDRKGDKHVRACRAYSSGHTAR